MFRGDLPGPRSGRTARVALVLVACLLTGLAVAGAAADAEYRRSLDRSRTVEQRAADAQTACCLAPWGGSYRTHASVMADWLGGKQLLEAGDYSGAVEALRRAYRRAVGDRELLALFQRAQEIEAIATNRKAHLQHGHEGPGSTLRPQDVER